MCSSLASFESLYQEWHDTLIYFITSEAERKFTSPDNMQT